MNEQKEQNQNYIRDFERKLLAEYNEKLVVEYNEKLQHAIQQAEEKAARAVELVNRRERMFQLVCALVSKDIYPPGITEVEFWKMAARILDAEPTEEAK